MARWMVLAGLFAASVATAQPKTPGTFAPTAPTVQITASGIEIDGESTLAVDAIFEIGEAALKPNATRLLDALAAALAKDQNPKVTIGVHADDTAPDNDLTGVWIQKLTQRRADAIKNHLAKKGIVAKRITAVGHGSLKPIADNGTESGKRANRRIEFSVETDVRAPTAGDLPGYVKPLRGAGPQLIATIETSLGTLRCELFADRAPMAVANFIGLATGQKAWLDTKANKVVKGKPFYDGLVFHRVIPGFMIQGGDPLGTGTGGPGYKFADEIAPDLQHGPGTLAMANAGPATNGSQFFIDEVEAPWLNGKHTIFGECKETDVIKKITGTPRSKDDRPNEPVTIKKLTVAKGTL